MNSPAADTTTNATAATSESALVSALHIFALFTLAVGQPLFELIGIEPMTLVTHRATPFEIVGMVLLICVMAPAVVVALAWGVGRIRPWMATCVQFTAVAALTALIALPSLKRLLLLPGVVLIGLAILTGLMVACAYLRWAPVRTLVSFASFAIVLLPGLFLFRNPVRSLLFPVERVETMAQQRKNLAPVVMIVFDEFCGASLLDEHRQIDAVRYPNFAELSQRTTWYRNATTVSENTMHALPALVTGNRPVHSFPPTVANYPHNLFTLLKDGCGYELTVFEPFTTLCPELSETVATDDGDRRARLIAELVTVYTQFLMPFDLAKDPEPRRARQLRERNRFAQRQKLGGLVRYERMSYRREQWAHFLECLSPSDSPKLYYLHVLLPHGPYEYLPSGRTHTSSEGEMAIGVQATMGVTSRRSDDPLEAAQEQQAYLLQVGFVDRLVGNLVSRLKDVGLYDRCLLVLVGDHGIAFRPGHPHRDATRENYPDVMSIPLFIKAPGQTQGNVSDRNVESIDVLPTMAGLLGVPLPWSTDGASAADPAIPERPQKRLDTVHHGAWPFDAPFLDKDSSMIQSLRLFGSGAKPGALYRLGPHSELIGRQVEEFEIARLPAATIEMTWRPMGSDASPEAMVPCVASGRVERSTVASLPVDLAIALDGRIVAVTRTSIIAERADSWRAMVPEDALLPQAQDLRVFIVGTEKDRTTLQPTMIVPPP